MSANALHPGVIYTPLLRGIAPLSRLAKPFVLTPEAAADSLVYLATAPELATVSGAYFHRTRQVPPARRARNAMTARRLWQASEALTGLYWDD